MCGEDVSSRCVSCGGWKNKIEGALFNKGMCPYYPCPASCPDLSLKEANDQRLKKRSRTVQRLFQHVFKLWQCQANTTPPRTKLCICPSIFVIYILTYSRVFGCLYMRSCLLYDIVFTRSSVPVLWLQEIKGWSAWGQVIQSADDECSSVWKQRKFIAAQKQHQGWKFHVNPQTAGKRVWKWCNAI